MGEDLARYVGVLPLCVSKCLNICSSWPNMPLLRSNWKPQQATIWWFSGVWSYMIQCFENNLWVLDHRFKRIHPIIALWFSENVFKCYLKWTTWDRLMFVLNTFILWVLSASQKVYSNAKRTTWDWLMFYLNAFILWMLSSFHLTA